MSERRQAARSISQSSLADGFRHRSRALIDTGRDELQSLLNVAVGPRDPDHMLYGLGVKTETFNEPASTLLDYSRSRKLCGTEVGDGAREQVRSNSFTWLKDFGVRLVDRLHGLPWAQGYARTPVHAPQVRAVVVQARLGGTERIIELDAYVERRRRSGVGNLKVHPVISIFIYEGRSHIWSGRVPTVGSKCGRRPSHTARRNTNTRDRGNCTNPRRLHDLIVDGEAGMTESLKTHSDSSSETA